MTTLFLEDLKDFNLTGLKKHLCESYNAVKQELSKYEFLIAYESVGSWGCDSSSYFLMRDKESQKLYEVIGSHCSCYGFEDQFTPEETTLQYLQSDKFYLGCGGYDGNEAQNKAAVKSYLMKLK